ncbi:MAG: hypothetical protein HY649_11770 [Acidobacteria bacterium]|nr:hypothetical protein [Acidobacteriota bacterium]
MNYILTKNTSVAVPTINLSEIEYVSIKTARNILTNGLSMEEKYDLVISNYSDFEIALMDSAVHSMIGREYTYHDSFLTRAQFNKRIVNLLTAARMYCDQLQRHVAAAVPTNPNAKLQVQQLFSEEKDKCFEYRFMEALRNFVQHFGFPVHWTKFAQSWDGAGGETGLLFTTEVGSSKTNFQEDDAFKKAVLNEAPAIIDLKETIRKYVEALSRVHASAREIVQKSLLEARSTIENAISRYQMEYAGDIVGLFAFFMGDEDAVLEKIPVMLEWDDIRVQLEKRNQLLVNLSKRYVSSKIQPKT